jgi:hypothetical protein
MAIMMVMTKRNKAKLVTKLKFMFIILCTS